MIRVNSGRRQSLSLPPPGEPAAQAEEVVEVLEDEVEGGDEDEGDHGGEEDAEAEADRHGDQELRLDALFQDHRREAEEGGEISRSGPGLLRRRRKV